MEGATGNNNKHKKNTDKRKVQVFLSVGLKLKQRNGLEKALKGREASVISGFSEELTFELRSK